MRPKWRLLFVGAVVFVLYVSYKILEPELFRSRNAVEGLDEAPFHREDEKEDTPEVDHHRKAFDAFIEGEETVVDSVDGDRPPINLTPDAVFKNGVRHIPKDEAVPVDQVIRSMIDRYTPLYSHKLDDSPWKIAASWVDSRQIHPHNAQELGAVLHTMAQSTIIGADVCQRGTQLKLTLLLEGNQKVVFKPAWYPRDYIVTGKPYAGRDRHNAEIAAFHLGRILELRRTPLAIGRRIDIEKEIMSIGSNRLLETFFEKDGEHCFYGKCLYCKGPDDGVCATNGILEGTVVLWLPSSFKMKLHKHPWSRTYRENSKARWETDNDYCAKVQEKSIFSSGPGLLDIIDTCVFDYLIGNADRHHYETFEKHEDSMLIILDNGKSFGNPSHDELSILAPLYQCCQIRSSLWQRLLALQDGVLSKVLSGVLAADPISPILTPPHLEAMDRRLKTILEEVQRCIDKVGINAIVMDSYDKGR